MNLFENIELNKQELNRQFTDCQDIVERKFPVGEHKAHFIYVTYIDMAVNKSSLELNVIARLMSDIRLTPDIESISGNIYNSLKDGGMSTAELEEVNTFDEVTIAMLSGDAVVFIDGFAKAIVISVKGWPGRGVPTADNEVTIQGSKEAFSESFRINTMLIRRRIRDTRLKLKQIRVGERSKTDIAIMYMEDIVRPKILREAEKKLKNINIDAIMDSGYVEQLIEDDWLSPFPQTQLTERPDKAASAILEGRIVIIVDNSPFVVIIPTTMNTFFQASDDYYQRFHIVILVRILRFICAFISIALPGIYLATTVYHPSMIPMLLTFKMAGARQLVPFPAVVEILIMEIAFELLREAGIRLPGPVGSAIGIVGGLIVGNAAVDAGIVSPIVVIIVALTGIASFTIPQYSLTTGIRVMKYLVTICSALLGLFGFWTAIIMILIHLASLKSFGIPYLFPFVSGDVNDYNDWEDTVFRLPIFKMKKRPIYANPDASVRLHVKESGNKKDKE